jgi:DNA-binding NarL/FixJ family response regulator
MVNLVIADSSILIRLGIKTLLHDEETFSFMDDSATKEELLLNNKK